jgi:hypothetical protein
VFPFITYVKTNFHNIIKGMDVAFLGSRNYDTPARVCFRAGLANID